MSSPKRPRTAAEWRALAAELAEQAERMWDDETIDPVKAASVSKRGLRALAIAEAMEAGEKKSGVGESGHRGLPSVRGSAIIPPMDFSHGQGAKVTPPKKKSQRGRKAKPNVFRSAILEAGYAGYTDWAEKHKFDESTVANWVSRGWTQPARDYVRRLYPWLTDEDLPLYDEKKGKK